MATYRLVCIDDGNHIAVRQDFDAEDDVAAIA